MIKISQLRTRPLFGQLLLQKGFISEEELNTALNLQKQSGEKIGKLLVDIGALSEGDMVRHLAEHLGVSHITSEDFPQVPVL